MVGIILVGEDGSDIEDGEEGERNNGGGERGDEGADVGSKCRIFDFKSSPEASICVSE